MENYAHVHGHRFIQHVTASFKVPRQNQPKCHDQFRLFLYHTIKNEVNIYTVCRPLVYLAGTDRLNPIRFSLVQNVRTIYGFTINHDVFLGQEKSSAAVNGREWKILLKTLND